MNQSLREELHHPDKSIRSRAVISLGNDMSALDALIQALAAETDVLVREDITWSLVRMGDIALLPLIHMLYDENPMARHHAAHTLGKIGDARAVNALIETLHDCDSTVVLKAAFALGQIGDERAVPALVDLLGSENEAIESMLVNVLEGFGQAAVNLLIEALVDERWQMREQAAQILGIIGSRDAEDMLIRALQDTQWQVRFAAVTALGQFGKAKAAIQELQHDPDQRVQSLAAKVVRGMKG